MKSKRILVVGTYDTKSDELNYLCQRIEQQGATCLTMDVSVLGDPPEPTHYSKHEVAQAADGSIAAAIAFNDENAAMQLMARGASTLASQLYRDGMFDGMIALGGSMATDLALDIAQALPVGVPKYIVSTVAFAAMIPAERLAADIQMILWAGGLYGLNSVCRASLSQAAGAVVGATQAVAVPGDDVPLVGMTSLGKSCLKYMVHLKPELEKRGFEVAVFHATGMGGRAFESMASQGRFALALDLCTQELGNWLHGSIINAGSDRMLNAGLAGIPQIVAPGGIDMVDVPTWMPLPEKFKHSETHVHNRLINSISLNAQERSEVVELMAERLSQSDSPVHVLVPQGGIEEWDREGEPLHAKEALAASLETLQTALAQRGMAYTTTEAHINDRAFSELVLAQIDRWMDEGVIKRPVRLCKSRC